MKKFWSLTLVLSLFFVFGCEGTNHGFRINNNSSEKIIIYSKPTSYSVKKTIINAKQKNVYFRGGFSAKKEKPSEFLEYVKITKEDGTVLFDLRGKDLDEAFKVLEEYEYHIDYRFDVD